MPFRGGGGRLGLETIVASFTSGSLASVRLFTASNVFGEIRLTTPGRSAPDRVRASRKNECFALNKSKPMISNFKVSGQPMTS